MLLRIFSLNILVISSARTACAPWEARMFSCSPQSWLAYIVPVAHFLLAGMYSIRLPSNSLLQCHSFRMWQSRVWWVLLIVSHKVHWDNDFDLFIYLLIYVNVIAPLKVCGQGLHPVTAHGRRLIFSGESYKGACRRTDSAFFAVTVVMVSQEFPSLVWVGFLELVS